MDILNRFLKYISIPTNSDSGSNRNPSTDSQRKLAEVLVKELEELDVDEVYYDKERCYVYAYLKGMDRVPKIGFISHMDTSEAVTDIDVKPQIIKDYNGESIKINENEIIDTNIYTDLKKCKGKTLITTDGSTLLGADDKAGITEIMTMLEYIVKNDILHGDIYIAFTPDEEIGEGTKFFDFSKFKVDFAYTVDGSDLGEITYENFNAASINIKIKGVSAHLGSAKNILVNSQLIANEIINKLPNERPENTEGYEGYYHVDSIIGTVGETKIKLLIRDFDRNNFEKRKQTVIKIVDQLNEKYNNCINTEVLDTYFNMKDKIVQNMNIIENVKKAMENIGVTPLISNIRGGTDGARLTEKGILCPNLGTGAHNFHSIYEYVCLEDMKKTSEVLIEIVKVFSKSKK